MTECEKFALALEQAKDDFGVIKISAEVRDLLVKLLRGQPQWISVKDRLPQSFEKVLIYHRNGISYGWYNGRYWERGAKTNHRALETVTHWMPLPEPPEDVMKNG